MGFSFIVCLPFNTFIPQFLYQSIKTFSMKKNVLFLLISLTIISCSQEGVDEDQFETLNATATTTESKTLFVTATSNAQCVSTNTPQTNDLQVVLSEPASNDMILFFRVFELTSGTNGWSEIPGEGISVNAGEKYATATTSCYLPNYVSCGEYTGTYSDSYKFVLDLEQSSVIGGSWDYELYSDGEVIITAYRYCLGGGWDDGGGSGGGEEPGGLN